MNKEETKKLINDMIYTHRLKLDDIMEITKDQWIEKFSDLPPWAQPEVKELIDMGAIKGVSGSGENTVISASLNTYIRPCIVALRIAKILIGNAPKAALKEILTQMLAGLAG